jgi:N-acetylmuramoyl-L-alanine amidase
MFKLALNAGHYKYTAGKRCHAEIDPKQTREWELNNRICDKIEKILADYDGIEILRIDDTTGEKDVSLQARTDKANKWGADFWFSVHHNAAGKKFSGGGIVAYIHPNASQPSVDWQKALYNASVKATGLYGNRSKPLASSNLHELRETKMPSVLMECGFMDSTTDVPIILSEDFANKISKAFADVIIDMAKLTKKKTAVHYKVQVGAYSKREGAEAIVTKLKADGYDAIIVEADGAIKEPAPVKEIKVGSNVKLNNGAKTYTGGGIASYVYNRIHQVKQISGDRVVITYGGVTVAAVNKKDLTLV